MYCLKYTSHSIVVRQKCAGHLGTHSAECPKQDLAGLYRRRPVKIIGDQND